MTGSPVLEFRELGLSPTCIDNYRVCVFSDGTIKEMRNELECDPDKQWSGNWTTIKKLGHDHVIRLKEYLSNSGFSGLPEFIEDMNKGSTDGIYTEIEIWLDDTHHKSTLVSGESPVFDNVHQYLLSLLRD